MRLAERACGADLCLGTRYLVLHNLCLGLDLIDFRSLPNVVAIVGSREWPPAKKNWIEKCVQKLKPRTLVVSGEAPEGVDKWARDFTLERESNTKDVWFKGMACTKGEWELFGRSAGIQRNEDIVLFLKKHAGHMLIFALQDDIDAEKGGSFNDIEWCTLHNVPFTLITV